MKRALKFQDIFTSRKVREELLRYNNSRFDFSNQKIPFDELLKIRTDLMVSSLIESRLSGIVALKYTLKSDKSDRVEFVENVLKKIKINSVVRGAFKAVLFGFTPVVLEWETIAGDVVPKKLSYRSPREWRAQNVLDRGGQSDDLYYTSFDGNVVKASDFPYNIIVVFRNRDDVFPMGEGILEKLFWHIQYKNAGLDFWTKFSEKFGTPYILAEYQEGSDENLLTKAKRLLMNFVGGGWGLLPAGMKPQILEPAGKGQSSDVYKDLLNYCREDISMAILGHTGAAVSTAGKLGGDNTAMSVRDDIALSDSAVIEDFVSNLISKIIELNFADGIGVSFEFYKESANKELAERDKILAACGAKFNKNYFSKTYSISEDFLEDDRPAHVSDFAEDGPDERASADVFEELFDEVEGILQNCETEKEAREKLTNRFSDIDSEPFVTFLANSLTFANLKARTIK